MTVMSRMAGKGELTREKEGRKYFYRIGSRHQTSSKKILARIQEKIFGGKGAAMIGYLIQSDEEISDKELAEIEKLIQQRRLENRHG